MKKNQQDFESENMSDLVELINSKNNSRRILDVLRRNKKDKSKNKDKK
jgi:PHD/YefM family antitoxin component YafN of YafNO toxin-antitoxin module